MELSLLMKFARTERSEYHDERLQVAEDNKLSIRVSSRGTGNLPNVDMLQAALPMQIYRSRVL